MNEMKNIVTLGAAVFFCKKYAGKLPALKPNTDQHQALHWLFI
jgi:hypothetical protein